MISENLEKNNFPLLFKFFTSSGFILFAKLLILWAAEKFVSAKISYLISHIIIFFIAYLIHSKFTFKQVISQIIFFKYFRAVIFIKLFDYFLYFIIITFYEQNSVVIALISTSIVFIARFFILKIVFLHKK